MSTDTPNPEDGATPEEQLEATTPDAPVAASDASVADSGESSLPELTLGAGAPAEEDAEHKMPTVIRGKIDKDGTAIGTGRRKTSVARVRVKEGNGAFVVNGRPVEDYFKTERDRNSVHAPLKVTGAFGAVDVWVRVHGGGTTGQAGAVVLGVARALEARDPSKHHLLSRDGFLSRDSRMVERKKYGKRKARRSFQFSKR